MHSLFVLLNKNAAKLQKKIDMRKSNNDFICKKLGDFITNAKVFEAKEIRLKIIERCKVSKVTYSYWLNGTRIPNKKNQRAINHIVTTYGYPTIY